MQKCSKRLLAVDPSLSCSGWALFQIESKQLLAVGVLQPPGPKERLPERLKILQVEVKEIFELFELNESDVLICEGPAPLVKNPDSATKVEQVRGIFETLARVYGLEVPGRLNPRTVQTELLGFRGPQLSRKDVKDIARETALRLYGAQLSDLCEDKAEVSQDIIDAILIGSYSVDLVGQSLAVGQELSVTFAPGAHSKSRRNFRSNRGAWTNRVLKRHNLK